MDSDIAESWGVFDGVCGFKHPFQGWEQSDYYVFNSVRNAFPNWLYLWGEEDALSKCVLLTPKQPCQGLVRVTKPPPPRSPIYHLKAAQ